eukprot:3840066-Amphidinium_carterae.1
MAAFLIAIWPRRGPVSHERKVALHATLHVAICTLVADQGGKRAAGYYSRATVATATSGPPLERA